MPWFTQTVRTAHLQGYSTVLITVFYYYLNRHDRKGNQEGWEFKAQLFFTQEARALDCLNIYFCIKKTFKLSLISSHTTHRPAENSRFLGKADFKGCRCCRKWSVLGKNSGSSLSCSGRDEGKPDERRERGSTPWSWISAWPCARKTTKHMKGTETSKAKNLALPCWVFQSHWRFRQSVHGTCASQAPTLL